MNRLSNWGARSIAPVALALALTVAPVAMTTALAQDAAAPAAPAADAPVMTDPRRSPTATWPKSKTPMA